MPRALLTRSLAAFTLIELLVVVAVIGILAAIAVPNFMEAQTRAKVSRVYADFSTMRNALYSYQVEYNRFPRMTWGGKPWFDSYRGEPISGTMGYWMTTPIAYMTRFDFMDPFTGPNAAIRTDARLYSYHHQTTLGSLTHPNQGPYIELYPEWFAHAFGRWAMMSLGPNLEPGINGNAGYITFHEVYDPSNGTISHGNIWWSENFSEPRYIRFGEFN